MQFIVWFVPSLIGNAIAVSFMGMFLGPIYPIVMNQAGRILPPRLLTGSISWIGGIGQAGSAFMPFVTGALASSKGIQSIQPLCVPMLLCLDSTPLTLRLYHVGSYRCWDLCSPFGYWFRTALGETIEGNVARWHKDCIVDSLGCCGSGSFTRHVRVGSQYLAGW